MRSRTLVSPMLASRSLCLLCLILFPTLAQTSKPATASISGRITDGEKPLAGITVTARDSTVRTSGISDLRGRATTDSDGRYRIADLPSGKHKVVPQHALYVVKERLTDYGEAGRGFNLAEGENIENADFTLTKGGVIAGRVTDYDGKPAIEQQVGLMRLEADGKWRQVNQFINYRMRSTDDRGDYRLFGLEAGQYKVFVGKAADERSICGGCGNNFRRRVYYPSTTDEPTAQVITVKPGQEASSIDIRLQGLFKTHDVAVRVVDAQTGQPVAGVMCGYGTWNAKSKSTGARVTGPVTAANGETLFQAVAPGTYGAFVSDGGEGFSEYAVFEVTEEEAPKVEIKMQRGKFLSGQVVWVGTAHVAAARATARQVGLSFVLRQPDEVGGADRGFTPNPDDSFRVSGVASGNVGIRLEDNGNQAGFKLLSIEHQGVRHNNYFTMPANSNLTDVKLHLLVPGQSSLRGQLQFVNGTFPPDAVFVLRLVPKIIPLLTAQGDFVKSATPGADLDQRGHFEISRIYPGEYELTVYDMSALRSLTRQANVPRPTLPPIKQTVQINEGSNQVTIRIDLAAQRKEGQ